VGPALGGGVDGDRDALERRQRFIQGGYRLGDDDERTPWNTP
jgi:hypothetical protein